VLAREAGNGTPPRMAAAASVPGKMTLSDRLTDAWYRPEPSLLATALRPLAWIFRGAVAARRALYRANLVRAERLAVPVIVVGNIGVGGTGKTPLTIALALALRARGWKPGIVSRGHGGSDAGPRAVAATDDPRIIGDEPPLLAATGCPTWIGHARPAAARGLLAANPGCDVIVCDDGLQHYALARDVEIAVIDGARGLGNGLMLPAGPLREPAARLSEVDFIVRQVAAGAARRPVTDPREALMTLEPEPWRSVMRPDVDAGPQQFRGADIHAVAGIGNPQRFFDSLRAQGIAFAAHAFPDHHAYGAVDIAFPGSRAILMTEKDAVKCREFADERCWYLPVRAVIDPEFVERLEEKIRGPETA
jgi:tetraacyldisaccharide 4'-kinase